MRRVCLATIAFLASGVLLGAPQLPDSQTPTGSPATLAGLTWSSDSTQPARFIAVHGRRSAIFGYSSSGLEVWAYPLQILQSFHVAFLPQHATTPIDGRNVLRRVIYRPESVTRIYAGPDFIVREKLFVPLDVPGAVMSYEVHAERPVDVVVRFVPVLNLMWPGGIGGQEITWDPATWMYRLSEPTGRFAAVIGSPDIVAHDETPNVSRAVAESPGIAFTIRPHAGNAAHVVVAADTSGTRETSTASELLRNRATLETAAVKHYESVLAHELQIDTPDPEVDRALAWSEIAVDQAWVCNPDLGCALVAGYGPSRKARRPQYDWFFAGDGLIATRALLAAGQYERAREEIEFILRFQDRKSGMIWHELSQSAGLLNWSQYPYLYAHVDLSFDFLDVVAEYLSVTGDRRFVSRNWHALEAAYRYCRSLLDPSDGLPRIPAGKQGQNEQDPLSDELTLSAAWVAASEAFATLADATGHHSAAAAARRTSERAREAVNRRYWDETRQFWISGHTRTGAPVRDRDVRPAGALQEGVFSESQRNAVLDQIASADFQTDWGTRGKAANDPTYDPNSYASGSVWALGTSTVASAFWAAHRPETAFAIWSALVPWSSLDSLGHMHETLAGDRYHEEVESVPEQTWSSASFFTAAVHGLLGLRVEGAASRLEFAPHLPAAWDRVTLRNVRVGSSEIALDLSRSSEVMQLRVTNDGEPIAMSFDPVLPLGAHLVSARIGSREMTARLEQHPHDTHAHVTFDVPHGESLLTMTYSGGVEVIPALPRPHIGDGSEAVRIVRVALADQICTIEVDRTGPAARLDLRTPWKIESVRGATLETLAPSSHRLTIDPAPGGKNGIYSRSTITITFASTD